ncbi:hypothetical protein C8J57DRAFT_199087 [Mycena rebaudengoi]|nr:hypothetical protein C8J57DRAFT_199087 [Mycena rebaudengoi]
MVESNALYLVTGVDKCSSWSVAAVENQSEDFRVSLKLKASQLGSAGTTCAWEWETASSFADSGPRRLPGEELWDDNQTVFLRGFKVAIRPTPLKILNKALSIVDSKPSEILSKSGFIPYSGPSSGGTSSFYRSPTQPNGLSNSDDSEYIEYFPTSLAESHPANAINAYLLDSYPDAMVAITHDDEWASVLNEDDDEMPEDAELITRVLNKYETGFAQGGIWLEGCQLDDDLGPQKSSSAPSAPQSAISHSTFSSVPGNMPHRSVASYREFGAVWSLPLCMIRGKYPLNRILILGYWTNCASRRSIPRGIVPCHFGSTD